MMTYNFIKRMVEKCGYKLCVCWTAIRVSSLKRPFLLCARLQSVTERFPSEQDAFVGHWSLNLVSVLILHTVSHPREGNNHARAIFFLVVPLACLVGIV